MIFQVLLPKEINLPNKWPDFDCFIGIAAHGKTHT